jgi:hypothetical protein
VHTSFYPLAVETLSVSIGNRADEFTEVVPEELYSSLRYIVKQRLPSAFFETQNVISKIEVVDSSTGNPILKDRNPVIEGGTTSFVCKEEFLKGETKLKFKDSSFKYRSPWAFRVSFYDNDLVNPSLVLMSAPFVVRARKPSKRKRDSEVSQEQSNKKKKSGKNLDIVKKGIDDLMQRIHGLDEPAKDEATGYLKEKLGLPKNYEEILLSLSSDEATPSIIDQQDQGDQE